MNTEPTILKRYFDYLRFEKRDKPRTIQGHEQHIKQLETEVGDLLKIKSHHPITAAINKIEVLQNWRDTTTKKFERSILSFYKWALRDFVIDHNPFPFSGRRTTRAEQQPHFDREIDHAVIESILFHPNWTARDVVMLRIMFACGLRRQEIADLRIDDIDLLKRNVRVRRGKGDKWRYVPFDPENAKYIEPHVKVMLRITGSPSARLFQREDFSAPLSGSGIWKSLDRMGKKIGVKCNPKKWRSSFAGYFMEKGMLPKMVSDMMGHARVSTTLDHYTFHRNEKTHAEYDRIVAQHA